MFKSFGNLIGVFIALRFFGFYTLVLFFLIMLFLQPLFGILLINRKLNIKLKIYRIFKPFIFFSISILISILIFFYNFNLFPFFYNFNLFPFFYNFNLFPTIHLLNLFFNGLLKSVIFFFIFYLIIYFSKSITKEEFNSIINLIPILRMDRLLFRNIVKLIEKILPHQKSKNF